MKIALEELRHISDLAKLDLSEEEIGLFTEQLNEILNFVSKLNELDTTQVEPTSHVLNLETPFRDDDAKNIFTPDESLKNAPEKEKGYFKVPRIIEG